MKKFLVSCVFYQPYLAYLKEKFVSASFMEDDTELKFKQQPEGLFIYTNMPGSESADQIIRLKIQ